MIIKGVILKVLDRSEREDIVGFKEARILPLFIKYPRLFLLFLLSCVGPRARYCKMISRVDIY